ncbi:formylglycine-generating enzyme family protein [bacterium]|nr:formylglycine-generating enzyme family protein [bacterium]
MIDINKTTAKYLVLDLTTFEMREEENGPMEDPAILNDDRCRTTELWLRRIEAGTFIMGTPNSRFNVQHEVTLTWDFYIGVFEITQKQYELITGDNPSVVKGDKRPVDSVSYYMIDGYDWKFDDTESFLGKISSKAHVFFDLPTEAQWEYACRAGTTTDLNSGKNISGAFDCEEMAEVGRYRYNVGDECGHEEHTTVGSYKPNAWGLYDMHGNVWEWCFDGICSYRHYYSDDPVTDPVGDQSLDADDKVLRGGSWDSIAEDCCSDNRNSKDPRYLSDTCGFRVVIDVL